MPQLDKVTWFSQIFWFLVVFAFFYFVMVYLILPTIAASLKLRSKQLAKIDIGQRATASLKNEQLYAKLVKASLFLYPQTTFNVKTEITLFVLKLSGFLKENVFFKSVTKDTSRLLVLVRFMQEEIKKNA